jgi:hypothetical protein
MILYCPPWDSYRHKSCHATRERERQAQRKGVQQ